jgi:hypothetical protein
VADEIKLDIRFTLTNGSLKYSFAPGQLSIDQTTGAGPTPGFLTVGTSEESTAFGELATLGMCILQNLDATNYVEFGFSTGVYGIKLKPGEAAVFRLNPSSTLYMKADTASCKVLVLAFDD